MSNTFYGRRLCIKRLTPFNRFLSNSCASAASHSFICRYIECNNIALCIFQTKAELVKEYEAKLQTVEFGFVPNVKTELKQ